MRYKLLLALLAFTTMAASLLSGPAGLGPGAPQSAEAALPNEVKKLLASDAQALDDFGFSVAISGDTAVVGAFREDSNIGAAYVFQRNQGGTNNWGEVKKLTASDAQVNDWFGWSVAVSGDTVVVGAFVEDGGAGDPLPGAGAVYVFQRDQGGANNWGEVKKLVASDAAVNDEFGYSVAISGDTAVVGAILEDAGGGASDNFGAAYILQRNEGGANNWGEAKKLTASDTQASDQFGVSMALSGDTLVVGANLEDAGGSDAGASYIFQRDEGGANNWGQVTKLFASGAQAFDSFGASVAVSGDTAVVGAYGEDGGTGDPLSGAGAAYVFQRNEGGADNWGQVAKLTASDARAGDRLYYVAVSGDTVVAGADQRDTGNSDAGAAYVFRRDQGGVDKWGEVTKLTASDAQPGDLFGASVALSDDTAIIGARDEDAGAGDPLTDAGAAYIFQPPPKQPFKGDTDGDGCPDVRENLSKALANQGGGRDYKDPWDFYDTNGDGVIDLLFDILGVIQHYQPIPGGAPPYDITFDRGPQAGPNSWNLTAPDGIIDLLNDILGVIRQHSHNCT